MQSDYPFVIREYAEAHTLTLVLCRPDGARKRSVRALRKSPMIYKLARMALRFLRSLRETKKPCNLCNLLTFCYQQDYTDYTVFLMAVKW